MIAPGGVFASSLKSRFIGDSNPTVSGLLRVHILYFFEISTLLLIEILLCSGGCR